MYAWGIFFNVLYFLKLFWERERKWERRGGQRRGRYQFVAPLIYALIGCFLNVP